MSEQDAKRKRISDLLDAEIEVVKIMDIVKCSRSLVFKVAKMKKDGQGLERKAGSGGHNLKRTPEFLERLEKKTKEDPTKPMNCLFNDFPGGSGVNLIHEDSEALVEGGYQEKKAHKMLKSPHLVEGRFSPWNKSTTEGMTVAWGNNRRGTGGVSYKTSGADNGPGSRGVKREEDATLLFKAGEKIRKETYYKVLRYTVLPWLKANYPEGNMCGRRMVLHHTRRTCAIRHVALLLAGSGPLDFAVWGELEKKTNRTPHPNVDALKATIRTEWDNMSEEFLINSCKAFHVVWKVSLKLKEATSSESAHKGPAHKFC
ncbi:Uncharacterized protein FKW44_021164 [Caligus rogercresseyi]|uniref:Uncharacterized protein n=2 Tax=Caligus rogercresseyi TaxID=217165 RepID=A0A7T8JV41_CALRO|nr:Uncharacterized protein FKW44_021164 [Caligus rogercresseyi]